MFPPEVLLAACLHYFPACTVYIIFMLISDVYLNSKSYRLFSLGQEAGRGRVTSQGPGGWAVADHDSRHHCMWVEPGRKGWHTELLAATYRKEIPVIP